MQQAVGNRDLDLKREAEDGDAALGGTHTEALVCTTGVSTTTSPESMGSQRSSGMARDGRDWPTDREGTEVGRDRQTVAGSRQPRHREVKPGH